MTHAHHLQGVFSKRRKAHWVRYGHQQRVAISVGPRDALDANVASRTPACCNKVRIHVGLLSHPVLEDFRDLETVFHFLNLVQNGTGSAQNTTTSAWPDTPPKTHMPLLADSPVSIDPPDATLEAPDARVPLSIVDLPVQRAASPATPSAGTGAVLQHRQCLQSKSSAGAGRKLHR